LGADESTAEAFIIEVGCKMPKLRCVAGSTRVALLAGSLLALTIQSSGAATVFTAVPNQAAVENKSPAPSAAPIREAQTRPPAPAAAAPAKPAQDAPRKIETTTYDSWTVTCDATAGGAAKKKCLATLRVVNQNRGLVLNWQIGSNEENRYITAIHIPSAIAVKQGDKTVGGPILVGSGIELKFGNGGARRLSFITCGPKQCVAEGLIDDGFIKEAIANTKATLTIHTPGADVPLEVAITGIDKAISSTR
jgi:invasion protein IalB